MISGYVGRHARRLSILDRRAQRRIARLTRADEVAAAVRAMEGSW